MDVKRSRDNQPVPYITQVTLTAEEAQQWLDEKNTRNRKLKTANIRKIAQDMKNGDFFPYVSLIEIYETGELADGQNRLTAQVMSGSTITWNVLWDVPLESGAVIDRGVPRSEADAIQIGGLSDWIGRREIPIIKMVVKAHTRNPPPMTTQYIAEAGEFLKDPVQFATQILPGQKRYITTSPVLAAIAIASANMGDEQLIRLMQMGEVLYSGMPEGPDDVAVIRLREYLMSDRKHRGGQTAQWEDLLKTQRAIKAFVNRERIQKLYTPPEMIYTIEGMEDYL